MYCIILYTYIIRIYICNVYKCLLIYIYIHIRIQMYIKQSPQKGFMKLGVPLFYNWDDAHISTYLLVTEMFDGMGMCLC